MPQLIYGTQQQIQFSSDAEYYEALGFLCKNDNTTSLHWENNELSGAWGSEGRIHCYQNLSRFPRYFSNAFTAGTGNILRRINCNEYVACIRRDHGFVFGRIQNLTAIKATIPAINHGDFDRGVSL